MTTDNIDRAAETALEVEGCVALTPERWTAQATTIIRRHMDAEVEVEQGRWQEAIRNLVMELTGEDVDGGGCDSGDPLDVTLAEVSMGVNALRARLAAAEKRCEEAKTWMEHLPGCGRDYGDQCDCGLDAWLAANDAAGKGVEIHKHDYCRCDHHVDQEAISAILGSVATCSRCGKRIGKDGG